MSSPKELAKTLFEIGYIVVEGTDFSRADAEKVVHDARELRKPISSFREISSTRRLVCGGTSFVGMPTIFHHPKIRRHHNKVFIQNWPILREYTKLKEVDVGRKLKVVCRGDRMQVRPAGECAGRESAHRDAPVVGRDAVTCLGSFQNLNHKSIALRLVPGTHLRGASGGFKKLSKEEAAEYKARMISVDVPPGCFVIWDASVVHEVNPVKEKYTSVKVFTGFMITPYADSGIFPTGSKIPLSFDEIRQRMLDNAPMMLASGQECVALPKSYINFPKQMPRYTEVFLPTLVDGAMPPVSDMKMHIDKTRAFRSLKEMGQPLFAPYHPVELSSMVPQYEPQVFDYDTNEVVTLTR